MKITRTVVPSIFTALNIFCGFLSIIFASQGQFTIAAWIIIAAALFDSLDGIMARMTRSSSQFGVELDSLADVVSFGAAPSFMVYQVFLRTIEPWGILIAALPVVLGAIRLARFNVQLIGFDKDYFNGLPIPMQAITVCAFILQFGEENIGLNGLAGAELAALVVVLSFLMVSHVKYDTMTKISKIQMRLHPWKFIFIFASLLVILCSKLVAEIGRAHV
jgi:CDP-diacylglycerol---serine O-phosphatidyltransferase